MYLALLTDNDSFLDDLQSNKSFEFLLQIVSIRSLLKVLWLNGVSIEASSIWYLWTSPTLLTNSIPILWQTSRNPFLAATSNWKEVLLISLLDDNRSNICCTLFQNHQTDFLTKVKIVSADFFLHLSDLLDSIKTFQFFEYSSNRLCHRICSQDV